MNVLESLNGSQNPSHRLTFWALLAAAIILRLAAFQGYAYSDPRAYAELALDLSRGVIHIPGYAGPPVFPIRLGIYAPTAILIAMFGLSGTVLGAYSFVVSIAGCVLIYLLTKKIFSPLAGLIALGALAIVPIDVAMASALWPDAIAAFWANLGVTFAFFALSSSKIRGAVLVGLLGGVSFGISWVCKETVVYLIPFVIFLAYVFYKRSSPMALPSFIAIALGAVAILTGETLFFSRLTSDPLFHYHTTEYNYAWSKGGFFESSSPIDLLARLFLYGPIEMLRSAEMSFGADFALVAIFWSVLFHQRKFLLPAAWLTSLLLMFNFMTTSFRSYKPLLLFDRYFYPILFPSLILVGGFISILLLEDTDYRLRRERRVWAGLLLLVFCTISAFGVRRHVVSKPQRVQQQVAATLKVSDVIYTDFRTAADLVFFRTGRLLDFDANTIPWEKVDETEMRRGAYVLIDRENIEVLRSLSQYEPPRFAKAPPLNWQTMKTFGNADLYVIAAN